MMGTQDSSLIRHHTLVREIEADWFDHRAVPWHRRATIAAGQSDHCFEYNAGAMSDGTVIGAGAQIVEGKRVRFALQPESEVLLPSTRQFEVSSACLLYTSDAADE